MLSKTPKLSRSQKKAMLQDIVPHQSYTTPYRSGLLTGGALAVLLALLVPNIVYSQPNDGIFYDIKRGAETIRSVVQPGFESQQTIEQDDDHNDSRGKGSDDKQEDRESSGPSGDDHRSRSSDTPEDSSDDSSNSSNSGSNSEPSGSTDDPAAPDHNTARDACKDALDQRKDNGEDIDSDHYKACDAF